MRLLSFEVKGLFRRFNYRIDLNHQDRITILHGPNGFGKTTILQMLGHALAARFTQLAAIPFYSMSMHFDTGSTITFTPQEGVNTDDDIFVHASRSSTVLEVLCDQEKGVIRPLSPRVRRQLAEILAETPIGLDRVAEDEWVDRRTGRVMNIEAVMRQYRRDMPLDIRRAVEGEEQGIAKAVRGLLTDMRVFVIDTQRLITNRNVEMMDARSRALNLRRRLANRETDRTPAVSAYAGILQEDIRDHLRSYGVKASELDRSLPRRIITGDVSDIDTEVLRGRYNTVVERRQSLVKAGLLEEQGQWDISFPDALDHLRKQVLRIYLDDMETKLNVFEGFAERVQLFTGMINGLFKHKKMEVGIECGFCFRTDEGKALLPIDLSSGEQHQLVLLFDLLFRGENHALILVDEPEISLHVEWQQQVLKNFLAISRLRDLDFLVATHSPDIIHDRWDLTVALGEAENA